MRIIRLQKERVSNKHVLSSQSVNILEDLVTVIMQAEAPNDSWRLPSRGHGRTKGAGQTGRK